MTNYREILRLISQGISQGISQRSIAVSCECSRNTVASVVKHSEEQCQQVKDKLNKPSTIRLLIYDEI